MNHQPRLCEGLQLNKASDAGQLVISLDHQQHEIATRFIAVNGPLFESGNGSARTRITLSFKESIKPSLGNRLGGYLCKAIAGADVVGSIYTG